MISDLPLAYGYLIVLIIFGILFTIIKDRKVFPSNSSVKMYILSMLLAFLSASLLFLLLRSGHWSGSGSCGPNGCINVSDQPIAEIVFSLIFPLTLSVIIGALYTILTEIPKLKTERRAFDAGCIILAGSLLIIFFLTGLYNIFGYISLLVILLLLTTAQYYRYILYIILVIIFILLYFG